MSEKGWKVMIDKSMCEEHTYLIRQLIARVSALEKAVQTLQILQDQHAPSPVAAQSPHLSQPTQPAAQQKPMTENQRRLIEDYVLDSSEPFPVGYRGFSSDQASEWIDQRIPPEYIAWRKRKLYGYAEARPPRG